MDKKLCYFALDIETTGLSPIDDYILECALIYDDGTSDIDKLPFVNILVHRDRVFGDLAALIMHGESGLLIECMNGGVGSKELIPQINKFINAHATGDAVLAGKNIAGFDVPFLRQHAFRKAQSLPPFHYRMLDVGSLFVRSSDTVVPNLAECCRRAGVSHKIGHRALSDCYDVVRCVRYSLLKG